MLNKHHRGLGNTNRGNSVPAVSCFPCPNGLLSSLHPIGETVLPGTALSKQCYPSCIALGNGLKCTVTHVLPACSLLQAQGCSKSPSARPRCAAWVWDVSKIPTLSISPLLQVSRKRDRWAEGQGKGTGEKVSGLLFSEVEV